MSNHKAVVLELDRDHCQAICEEVGERLRTMLDRETSALSPRLHLLFDRLAELDWENAPSIVFAMDDMAACTVEA